MPLMLQPIEDGESNPWANRIRKRNSERCEVQARAIGSARSEICELDSHIRQKGFLDRPKELPATLSNCTGKNLLGAATSFPANFLRQVSDARSDSLDRVGSAGLRLFALLAEIAPRERRPVPNPDKLPTVAVHRRVAQLVRALP